MRTTTGRTMLLLLGCTSLSCRGNDVGTSGAVAERASADVVAPLPGSFDRIERTAFNRRAVELDLPIFWRSDDNGNGRLDPAELVVTWRHTPRTLAQLVDPSAGFTPGFRAVYERMIRPVEPGMLEPAEKKRREAVLRELAQGRPTLIESDFSGADPAEKSMVAHLLRAAVSIERIYAAQKGTAGMEAKLLPGDTASAALFFRNQGPFCVAPKTERDPDCLALPEKTKPIFGLYPAPVQSEASFCDVLQKQKNGAELSDHFSVVVAGDSPSSYRTVKYSEAYRQDMEATALELDAAAVGLGEGESALKKYLGAAAKAFRDDDWEPANEAWLAMGGGHSKYYLRVGPDETYYEPCGWKAGFALAFARIDQESLEWRNKLEPIKQELENEVASLAGAPYRAREVRFQLPDFIQIVLNAGDNRQPSGATGGQSLPNWGAVAEHGGRTVTMTNLSKDPDSRHALEEQMKSLFCQETMAGASIDPKAFTMGVVLHEAAHNLGPAHDYKVGGKVDHAAFGGALAATLEELKAQTAALFFPTRLLQKKLVTAEEVARSRAADIAWGFGQIALGMYDSQGRPKNYAQLASIQLGLLRQAGSLEWKADQTAANAADRGCFELHPEKWDAAVSGLMKRVLQIKAKGDRHAADRLIKEWVDSAGEWKTLRDVIAERWLRTSKSSLVYAIEGL